jgi:Bax protein
MALKPFTLSVILGLTIGLFACSSDEPEQTTASANAEQSANTETANDSNTASSEVETDAPAVKTVKAEKPRPISTATAVAKLNQVITNTLRKEDLPDFSQYTNVKQKKQAFFDFMRPLAETANEQVLRLREELKHINPQRPNKPQTQRLARLAKVYKIKTTDPVEQHALLLRKLQTIPPSLVLAQAANESAWGTSRFATEGNNLFGQWCFKEGCGLVPSGRPQGATYEVRLFKTPQDSVSAYVRNLNSHGGYIDLRRIRECLLSVEEPVTGRALAAGLLHYSSRGEAYIKEIRQMIRVNKLEQWQTNWWGTDQQHACYDLVQLPQPEVNNEQLASSASSSDTSNKE